MFSAERMYTFDVGDVPEQEWAKEELGGCASKKHFDGAVERR
jgi:hypothetical protein